jgi:hypothetical protein
VTAPLPPALVARFKSCLDDGDAGPFLAAIESTSPGGAGPADRAALLDFLRGERARLIKLKTLGLNRGWSERMAIVETILARLEPGGDAAPR